MVRSTYIDPFDTVMGNQGIGVTGTVEMSLLPGMGVAAASFGTIDNGRFTWDFALNAEEEQLFTFWLRLPEQTGEMLLPVDVYTGVDVEKLLHSSTLMSLRVEDGLMLTEVESNLDALLLKDKKNVTLKKVANDLAKARTALDGGDIESTILSLVRAADELTGVEQSELHELRLMIARAIRMVALGYQREPMAQNPSIQPLAAAA